jgi:hypothetical protein
MFENDDKQKAHVSRNVIHIVGVRGRNVVEGDVAHNVSFDQPSSQFKFPVNDTTSQCSAMCGLYVTGIMLCAMRTRLRGGRRQSLRTHALINAHA